MNEAELHWLMASHAPEVPLMLEDFLRRPDWHQLAACCGVVGPSAYVRGPKADYEAVRALCGECPVRQECLEAAWPMTRWFGLLGRDDGAKAVGDPPAGRCPTTHGTPQGGSVPEWQTKLELTAGFRPKF